MKALLSVELTAGSMVAKMALKRAVWLAVLMVDSLAVHLGQETVGKTVE